MTTGRPDSTAEVKGRRERRQQEGGDDAESWRLPTAIKLVKLAVWMALGALRDGRSSEKRRASCQAEGASSGQESRLG